MTGRLEGLGMSREQALADLRNRGINYTPEAPPTPQVNPAVNLSQLFQNLLQTLSQLQSSWSGLASPYQQPSPYQNNPYQTPAYPTNNYQPAPYQPAPYQPVAYPPVAKKGGQGGYS